MSDTDAVSVSPTCGVPLIVGAPVAAVFDPSTAASASRIVPVASPSAIAAPEASLRVSVSVSPPSSAASSLIGTDTVFVVSPASKVSAPLVSV